MWLFEYIRIYLLTMAILSSTVVAGFSGFFIVLSVLVCLLLDTFVIRKSPELAWYRAGTPSGNTPLQQLSRGQAVRLHLTSLFLSASIPVLAQLISSDEAVHLLSAAIAMLIAGLAASYCGFRLVRPSEFAREHVDRLDAMPDLLGVFELARPRPRRILFAMARIGLGLIALLPFTALLKVLSSEVVMLPLVLIVLVVDFFFQLGFVLLSLGIFSLRWLVVTEKKSKD